MNPPCKKPADSAKYREQYINNLRLSASNDAMNLMANKIKAQTGVSPALSRPPDNRTATEKYADFDVVKQELRSGLSEIADQPNISLIMDGLSNDEISYTLSALPSIIADLKPKWSKGVPAPFFIQYIQRSLQKLEQTRGVEFGLQQETGIQILQSMSYFLI